MTMRWEWARVPGHRAIVVRTSGRFNLTDHARMVREITASPDWEPGMDALFDHRALDFAESGYREMRAAGDTHEANDARIGSGRAAILMGDLADYGSARIFASSVEGRVEADVRVFHDETEARAWLGLA